MGRKPTSGRVQDGKWNLITGEDSYAGQNAQNPGTARKVQSWIPTDNGELHRELAEPKYLPTTLSGPVVGLYQFKQAHSDGTDTQYWFAAARTNFTPGTKTCNLYQNTGAAWTIVATVGTLADAPQCVTQQNNFYLADGASNWMFDGSGWVQIGLAIPLNIPSVNVLNGAATVFFGANPTGDANPVTAYIYDAGDASHHGDCRLAYPRAAAGGASKATGTSVAFNPPELTGIPNPANSPIQWATVDTSGNITGYTTPFASATTNYSLSVVFSIKIPKAGNYTIYLDHDDGAFFGISNGVNSGGAPTRISSNISMNENIWQTLTAVMGYPIPNRGGGINRSANSGLLFGQYSDQIVVNFPTADTYNFEINFRQWNLGNQNLNFRINGLRPIPSSSSASGINAVLGKYYWFTNADQTTGRATESSSSPDYNSITGQLQNATVQVYQQPGLFTSNTASTTVTGSNSTDNPGPISPKLDSTMVGKSLYINGTLIGTIASVSGNNITLTANAAASISNGRAVIVDARATHWHVYASESDGSKIGQFLAAVSVTQNLTTTPYVDSSPFIDDPANTYSAIFRPVRNDQPPTSKLLAVYKSRQWRRRESQPFFFNFTANEEVTSGNNGDPTQCVPGANVNTVSDMVNEVSYPDQSARLRALEPHMDALYIFSEKQCYPLYGESVDDFAIAQHVAFSMGGAGRFAAKSTPYGLAFVSYDRLAQLYPSSVYATRIAEIMDTTSQLAHIGKPMLNKLALIDPARLDEVVTEYYQFNLRSWWVVAYPQKDGTYVTFVYDFKTQRWFQLQRGFSSLKVFEISAGNFVLVGGAPDGNVYVIDDQTGTFNMTGTYPQSTFRTALIDFGDPDHAHVFRYLELEFNSQALAADTTITYWLDPLDVDNPGPGKNIPLRAASGAGRYRAFSEGGATCQKLLIQIQTRSSTHTGVIRGIKLAADAVPGVLPSNQAGGA